MSRLGDEGPPTYPAVEAALAAKGLLLRGGFHPGPDDDLPALANGGRVATLLLVGNAGPNFWPVFQAAPEAHDGADHAMNRWTEKALGSLAKDLGATVLFPFGGPPYHPFQRWAQRAEPVAPSPLGVLIHPRFGLWHAYRGALLFAETIELPPREELPRPCDSCAEKPCLSTCPVAAFGPEGYNVPACGDHIASPAGADCLEEGCRARRACPVGRDYLYPAGQAGFHMRAFLAALGTGGKGI